MDLSNFMPPHIAIFIQLGGVLDARIIHAPPYVNHHAKTFLGRTLTSVLDLHNEGRYDDRDVAVAHMRHLAGELATIREANPDAFRKLRSRLMKSMSVEQYTSMLAEITTASSLARAGIPFVKQESPDLRLIGPYDPASFECTSARVPNPQKPDVLYKISAAIDRKGRKPYSDESTAVLVEATNVVYNQLGAGDELDLGGVREAVEDGLSRTNLGSAIASISVFNLVERDTLRIHCRIDQATIGPTLALALDKVFPTGGEIPTDFQVTNQF